VSDSPSANSWSVLQSRPINGELVEGLNTWPNWVSDLLWDEPDFACTSDDDVEILIRTRNLTTLLMALPQDAPMGQLLNYSPNPMPHLERGASCLVGEMPNKALSSPALSVL
jgi:hypothetical protein